MSSERRIQSEVLLAAGDAGMTLWRNNVGQGWTGKAERLADGSVLIRDPRPLHAGICKGSSDLIGLRRVTVTEAHIGQDIAQFAAVEVKAKRGRVTQEQEQFLAFVRSAGGLSIVARHPDDLHGGQS
jgi:hypothetical protein